MARILEGFVISTIWANTPRDPADIQEPSQARQDEGFDRDYFQPGGDLPEGEHINYIFRRESALAVDIQRHGLLEWDALQRFQHPAATLQGHHIYLSTRDSGPGTTPGAVDPEGVAGTTAWRLVSATTFVPAALVTGTGDVILLAPDPAITAYVEGQQFVFRAEADSSQGVSVNVSGQGSRQLHFADTRAGSGQILNGRFYVIRYTGSRFDIVAESVYGVLPTARGGTNATTIAGARTQLELGTAALEDIGTASGDVALLGTGGRYVAGRVPADRESAGHAADSGYVRHPGGTARGHRSRLDSGVAYGAGDHQSAAAGRRRHRAGAGEGVRHQLRRGLGDHYAGWWRDSGAR